MNGWMDESLMNELMDWWMMFVVKFGKQMNMTFTRLNEWFYGWNNIKPNWRMKQWMYDEWMNGWMADTLMNDLTNK